MTDKEIAKKCQELDKEITRLFDEKQKLKSQVKNLKKFYDYLESDGEAHWTFD